MKNYMDSQKSHNDHSKDLRYMVYMRCCIECTICLMRCVVKCVTLINEDNSIIVRHIFHKLCAQLFIQVFSTIYRSDFHYLLVISEVSILSV